MNEENSSWNRWKWLRLLDKVLNYTSRFRWLISPKSVYLYCWLRQCQFASCRHSVRLLNLISHVFDSSGRVKEDPFSMRGTTEVRSIFFFFFFFFGADTVFFPGMRRSNYLSRTSANLYSSWTYFILFSFFLSTTYLHTYVEANKNERTRLTIVLQK